MLLMAFAGSALLGAGRIISFGLWLDADRDGQIAMGEGSGTEEPFHWWINDDDDEGDWQAGKDTPRSGRPDWSTPRIDGLRDLVDFFPVFLDCGTLHRMHGSAARYEVRCAGGGLEAYVMGLAPEDVGALHRMKDQMVFGVGLDSSLEEAEPLGLASGNWVSLPPAFLRRLSDPGSDASASLMVEGARAGGFTLELRITTNLGAVHHAGLAVKISEVESMYREMNLRGGLSRLAEPRGLPDAGLDEGWTLFVHGYNVTAPVARGWNAEMFKRLHALGCRRKFMGVSWPGDTGLDYHDAVQRAFFAGRALGSGAVNAALSGEVVLIAHSLGNVVAGEAVERGGWRPTRYFMVNAAVPAEAYAAEHADPSQAFHMTDAQWRGYETRLQASSWHALFSQQSDYRSRFRWSGAFGNIMRQVRLINAYSEGEDVTNCPEDVDSASVLAALFNGRDYSNGVWKTQELLKGVPMTRSLGTLFMRRSQAGWAFNDHWKGRYVPNGFREPGGHHLRMTPEEAALLTDEQLRTQPFFERFLWTRLHDARPRRPSSSALEFLMLSDVLARGVPARSYAAGCHRIDLDAIENVDLERMGRHPAAGWPQAGHEDGKKAGRWLHSDFRNAALPYVHPFFVQLSR